MRGLTALERETLAAAPDAVLYGRWEAFEALVMTGRFSVQPLLGLGGRSLYLPTELGRLALRVCPVDK